MRCSYEEKLADVWVSNNEPITLLVPAVLGTCNRKEEQWLNKSYENPNIYNKIRRLVSLFFLYCL